MSFIIQQLTAEHQPQANSPNLDHTINHGGQPSYQFEQGKQKQFTIECSPLEHYFLQKNLILSLRKSAKYHIPSSGLYYTLSLILNEQKYIKVPNRDRRLLLYKHFLHKISNKMQNRFVFAFHPHSGMVKIVLFNGCIISEQKQKHFIEGFMRQFYKLDQMREYLLLLVASIVGGEKLVNQAIKLSPQIKSAQSSMLKMATGLTISCNNRAQSSIVLNYTASSINANKILENIIDPSHSELLQLSLFCRQTLVPRRGQLCFSEQDLSLIQNKIKPPNVVKCKNLFQNNCILNFIKINNPDQLRLTKISQGGFSSIFITEIEYWYVFSGSENEVISPNKEESFTRESMFRKMVVFKREEGAEGRSRVLHEKAILKKIKNGNAIFLPKYYVPLNEPATNKTLFCDYIPSPNLSEFMHLHRQTLSLASKTLILLMLVQAMRFLSDYGVCHLDLKPQNVMVTRSMMVKLIDFGESFHRQVCSDDFIPGFTMPYGAPESYYPIDGSSFSSKNDIFSLGVIASEMTNHRLPLYFFNEGQHFERYTEQIIENFWYSSPEQQWERGDPQVFGLMQLVIGRCMDVRAERRPGLDWLCLIFREFLDLYY